MNYSDFKDILYTRLRAKTPLIIAQTLEPQRVMRALKEIAKPYGDRVLCYSEAKKFRLITDSTGVDNGEPLTYVAEQLLTKTGGAYVFESLNYLDRDGAVTRKLLELVQLAAQSGASIILVTGDVVWNRLSMLAMRVKLDAPTFRERVEYIKSFCEKHKIALPDSEIAKISDMLSGLGEMQVHNMLQNERIKSGTVNAELMTDSVKLKDSLYGQLSSVIKMSSDHVPTAGMSNLKAWLQEKKGVFFASQEKLKERDMQPPKGILIAGVPGCGKSLSAKLVASDWNLPFYRLDFGSLFSKWVGESEQNMRFALDYIDNVAPCVLWIDEIEKALSVTESTNESSARILGLFLFWLQESSSKTFIVATANRVDFLPPELYRKGRFSEVFFADLPDKDERAEAIALYYEACLKMSITKDQLRTLTDLSEGFSYADIEHAIKDVAGRAYNNKTIHYENVVEHFTSYNSISVTNYGAVQSIREWGKRCALAAGGKK